MLHACFTPIALCFVYTSWHFYAFFGTNLLTRCHSASSYFVLFFYSRFLPKEIFSELDKTKPEVPIFSTRRQSPKQRRRRARRRPHHRVAHPPPSGRATMLCGPLGCPLTSPFRLYIAFDAKTLKESASIHEKFRSTTAIEDQFRGIEVSVLAPCRDGELHPEPSPSTPPPSSLLLLTPMMRRE
jgi:hypothetical protein